MAMTRVAALVALIGVALVITGATVIFGPWALIVGGLVLLAAGVALDWEKAA